MSTGPNVVRHNEALAFGQIGTFFDIEFSDSSLFPVGFLGFKINFSPQEWRVMP
jgi:hypothetical protein